MANVDIQLEDMLESYPGVVTPGFQTLITAKKEFSEMASDPRERLPPGRGNFFKHQKFTHRYLRAYDDLVVIDETGTGKSCSIIGFLEYTRRQLELSKINPAAADEKAAHFKRVIILVKGPTQKNEFRNQLACRCSDGRYETGMVNKAKNEKSQKTNLTIEIKKAGYMISTYASFANRILEEYPTEEDNERLAEDFADTIFWGDEAHNLLIDPTITTTYKAKQRIYRTIWRVLHLARRSKRILSTATPMINDPKELGSLMNLILPLNGVLPLGYNYRTAPDNDIRVLFPGLPFDHRTATPEQMAPYFRGQFPSDYDFDNATLHDMEPFLRGRVGFIRAADTGAIPEEQGIPQDEEYEVNGIRYQSQLVIYTTAMSDHQSDAYILAKQSVAGRDELFGAERQAANFVFPDGYWGNGITDEERAARREARRMKAETKAAIALDDQEQPLQVEELPEEGTLIFGGQLNEDLDEETNIGGFERRAFRRYVNTRGDTFTPTPEFAPWLENLDYIRMLSCKFAEIVRLSRDEPGNTFVYSEFVEGSGAIVLALCFEGMGFVRYNETTSMFVGTGAQIIKPLCSGSDQEATGRRVRPDILSRQQGGPLRYAILTRDTSDTKFRSMMDAMNSYENRHGDYIKVLISSRVGRDAINVNNVLQIHLVGGEWNQSLLYQALSRGLRATSHDDLIREEQERIRLEGGDPATARITVKIYKHASIALDEANSSIDLQMYRMSEYKDRKIRRLLRIAKQCAVGCQVHYHRNVRPGDVDGSPTCDYDICNYPCVDPTPTEEDYSTYDVLYADEVINNVITDLVNIYRQRNALTLDDITALLPDYRRKYIIMALEKLVTNKIPLIDRFGYTTYLREDSGSFYLDRSYPTGDKGSYAMAYYTQGIIGIEQESLANIVVRLEAGENLEILADLEVMDPADPEFTTRLEDISIEGQAAILEQVLIRHLRGEKSPFITAILNRYQRMIFTFNEPITELNKLYDQAAQRRPRRGRKRNPDLKRRIRKLNPNAAGVTQIVYEQETEQVYLHTLYSQVINRTGYATTARFNKGEGRTRLLKPSELEDGWRDLNEIELPVYNALIQIEIARRNQPFEQQGLYGFILPDKKFRIRDKLNEAPGAAEDARRIKRGKVCEFWDRADLIDVMWEVGVQAPGGMFPNFTEDQRPTIIRTLLQRRINKSAEELATWTLDRLIYYYKWHHATKITRKTICQAIQQRMEETGRLIT